MPTSPHPAEAASRCDRLLALLETDPENLSLLSDTADAALTAGRPDLARDILGRYAAKAKLPEREAGLAGLAAMQLGDFEAAAMQFGALLDRHPQDAAIRFNLAWSLAMIKKFDDTLDLLDRATTEALPQAATLKVQLMHDRGEFEEALAQGRELLTRFPTDSGLLASLSVLGLDVEDVEFAENCARRAGNHPDAQTTLGVLALSRQDYQSARGYFNDAFARAPKAPRTLLGKGLVDLASGQMAKAASEMEEGAELFRTHIGSWIAAGWAHLLANDIAASRRCFETAYALDDTFAESHGSLAVIDLIEGRTEEATRKADVALRLDREAFSAIFVKACLAASAGRKEAAQAILQRALTASIGKNGLTVSDALARLSFGR